MSENEGAKEIRGFFGPYRFLSNFYPSPIKYGVNTYPTAEHLYQALKTKDKEKRALFAKISSPNKAKLMGRTIKLRPDWELIKLAAMKHVVKAKFEQNLVGFARINC